MEQEMSLSQRKTVILVVSMKMLAVRWEELPQVLEGFPYVDDEVVSMEIVEKDGYILHVTSKGIGKRTIESEYRKTNRGGKGYYVCRLTEDTGHVVKVKIVHGDEDLMVMTVDGVLIRIPVEGIPVTGRN